MLIILTTIAVLFILILSFSISRDLLKYFFWRVTQRSSRQSGKVNIGDCLIYYECVGEGQALVLLHGGLTTIHAWYRLMPSLARHYKIISIDFRGHGKSQRGTKTLSYKQYAEDVIQVLDHIEITRALIAGWSDGANTVLMLGILYPEYVHKLIAISGNMSPSGIISEKLSEIETLATSKPPFWMKLIHKNINSEIHAKELRDNVAKLWETRPQLSKDDVSKINAPTLLIRGEFDDISLEHTQKIQTLIPGSELLSFSGVGHNVLTQANKELLKAMDAFI